MGKKDIKKTPKEKKKNNKKRKKRTEFNENATENNGNNGNNKNYKIDSGGAIFEVYLKPKELIATRRFVKASLGSGVQKTFVRKDITIIKM